MGRRFDLVAYLKLFRFPLVFTAIADSAAGYVFNWQENPKFSPTWWLLPVASAFLYMFGMALNDIVDVEKDRISAPGKVLPSGRVSRTAAIVSALTLLFLSLTAVCNITETPLWNRLPLWGLIVLAILAYDLHWLKAPPMMGVVRCCNFLLGLSCGVKFTFQWDAHGLLVWQAVILGLPLFVYATALTYVSTLEDGALDRRKLLVGVSAMAIGALSAAVILPVLVYAVVTRDQFVGSWWGLGTAWILVAWIIYRARGAKDRKGLMLLVRDGVAGYILVDAAFVFTMYGVHFPAFVVVALMIPAALSLYIFKKLA
jgi:4-hydroxybenzoate polyprenyltransferase